MGARLDHGAIGDGRLIVPVAPTTAIEWLCLPRFDSPSAFAALIDPERGGYCWLRDAAVEALRRLLHLDEGEELIGFLRDVAEAGPRQPLDGVGGARELAELVLDHLAGFAGSGPVQIGTRLDARDGRIRPWI